MEKSRDTKDPVPEQTGTTPTKPSEPYDLATRNLLRKLENRKPK